MPITYFMERTLAAERGEDDANDGKQPDGRMRNRCPACPAWNTVMWQAYIDAYRRKEAQLLAQAYGVE